MVDRRSACLLILLGAVVHSGCAGPPQRVHAAPMPRVDDLPELDPEELLQRLLEAHNKEREADKLPSLSLNKKLVAAAQRHADDMAKQKKMDHKGSDGSSSVDRVLDAGYKYRKCGENIAWGPKTVEGVMVGWMNSPPHKKNILGGFTQIGAAMSKSENGTPYWCVVFGIPSRK